MMRSAFRRALITLRREGWHPWTGALCVAILLFGILLLERDAPDGIRQWPIALAGIALLCVIVECARRNVRHRADDVRTERLLGADDLVIALPLAWQTTLRLWGTLLLGGALFFLTLALLPAFVSSLAALRLAALPLSEIVLPFALLIPFLTVLGTWLGIRKI